jgi:hypothetical protein
MPVDVSWFLEGRIIYVKYYEDVTIEDKQLGAEQEYEFLEAGSVPLVHVLLDITDQISSPTNIQAIQKALDKALKHPKKGWTLAYGKEEFRMENFVNSVVTQSSAVRYRTFVTRQETLEFLVYVDPSLRDDVDIESD